MRQIKGETSAFAFGAFDVLVTNGEFSETVHVDLRAMTQRGNRLVGPVKAMTHEDLALEFEKLASIVRGMGQAVRR